MEGMILNLDTLPINKKIINHLKEQGIRKLFPPQKEAFDTTVLDGNNLVLAFPTSSGKTLVAEICMLKAILEGRGKAIYLVPLRSLAREKYTHFKEYESLGIMTAMSVGDYDSPGTRLKDADIVVLTTERADSLVRHKAEWVADVGIIVADEIHLVNDLKRGPTLEMVLAKMAQTIPEVQVIALSATISNADEISGWLNAELVKSSWRPVPLTEGIFLDNRINFSNGSSRQVRKTRREELANIVCDILDENGQVLVFVSSRRSTVSVAKKLASSVRPYLMESTLKKLSQVASMIGSSPSVPESTKILARLMSMGVAFHHAGLDNRERTSIEDCFKNNLLKVIVATPTLAAGVNLPARRVIIRDYRRFEQGRGSIPIPILEYKQMAGRAGRPDYDDYGEAVLFARTEQELESLMEHYILSEAEEITSKLASESAVRFHLLASIASEMTTTREEIDNLIANTFFSFQFNSSSIDEYIQSALSFLGETNLIEYEEDTGTLFATTLGKRVSQLYITPSTAILFRDALSSTDSFSLFGALHLVCHTPDQPITYVSQSESEDYELFLEKQMDELLVIPPEPWEDPEAYSEFLAQIKTARLLQDWISELSEREITNEYNVGMGDVHRYVRSAEWLVYSVSEIARVTGTSIHTPMLHDLRSRLRYGVRPELLELVGLRGVGRVRGRMLFNHNLRNLADLYSVSPEKLARIPTIGTSIAESIKRQLGVEVAIRKKEQDFPVDMIEGLDSMQTLLEDFEPDDD